MSQYIYITIFHLLPQLSADNNNKPNTMNKCACIEPKDNKKRKYVLVTLITYNAGFMVIVPKYKIVCFFLFRKEQLQVPFMRQLTKVSSSLPIVLREYPHQANKGGILEHFNKNGSFGAAQD
ncbi:hypothetical protein GR268_44935, partial [Rhizobium leguminosarum]|nr:hypothetical protein [Rhizobium leguminosarum]